MKFLRSALCALLLILPALAMGQEIGSYTNATSPLTGTERILADQSSSYPCTGCTVNITPLQIADFTAAEAANYGLIYNDNGSIAGLVPSATGQYCLEWTALNAAPTLVTCTSGGTPGGSTGQLQYNNAGAFAGIASSGTAGEPLLDGGTGTAPAFGTLNLSFTTGTLGCAELPALTGDVVNTNCGVTVSKVTGISTVPTTVTFYNNTSGTGVLEAPAGVALGTLTWTLPDATGTLLYGGGPLGTPSSGVATNLTGTAAGLSIGGTAANLSGTPALPNGTTATTQTTGDNSTKLATDAFVLANAASAGVSSVAAGTGVSVAGTGTGPYTGAVTVSLPTSGATAGSYTSANITVNAQGIVTAAANGTASASSITPGTTTVVGSTAPCFIDNSTGTTMGCASVGAGLTLSSGVLNTAPAPNRTVTTSPTVASTDMGGQINMNVTGGGTLTIPAISSSVFAAGQSLVVVNYSASTAAVSTTPTVNSGGGCVSGTGIPAGDTWMLLSNGTTLDCIQTTPSSSGSMVYPSAGYALSTGSAWASTAISVTGCTPSASALGLTAGTITQPATACTTATFTFSVTAPHGWICSLQDQTLSNAGTHIPADGQASSTTTACTVPISTAMQTASDVLTIVGTPY